MRILDLPHGKQTVIDEADWPLVQGLGALYVGTNGYVYYSRWEDGRSQPYLLHRLFVRGPAGWHVDHINGDKLDNRRENLRVVTASQNQVNRKRLNKNNTSGVRGVHRSASGKWIAQITYQRKNRYLGSFEFMSEAIDARRRAERALFREVCP